MIMRFLQHIPTLFAVIAYLVLPSCAPDTASSRAHQTKHFEEKSGYGVDLSHHNTVTNWELVEADFIFLKATEGSTFTDSKYISYRDKAQKHGIAVGAYHFMTTSSSAKRQFQNFYRVVGENIDLLPVLDVEKQTKGVHSNDYKGYDHRRRYQRAS
jgi:lysozyme